MKRYCILESNYGCYYMLYDIKIGKGLTPWSDDITNCMKSCVFINADIEHLLLFSKVIIETDDFSTIFEEFPEYFI